MRLLALFAVIVGSFVIAGPLLPSRLEESAASPAVAIERFSLGVPQFAPLIAQSSYPFALSVLLAAMIILPPAIALAMWRWGIGNDRKRKFVRILRENKDLRTWVSVAVLLFLLHPLLISDLPGRWQPSSAIVAEVSSSKLAGGVYAGLMSCVFVMCYLHIFALFRSFGGAPSGGDR